MMDAEGKELNADLRERNEEIGRMPDGPEKLQATKVLIAAYDERIKRIDSALFWRARTNLAQRLARR